jgi:hypothetical protein
MKNISIVLFFLIFFASELFAKEMRTRYGFYIDLPKGYISSTANMDDLLKENSDDVPVNKEYLNEMLAGSSRSDLNIEYFFPKKKYNPEFNNINLTMMDGNVREFLEYTMEEICSEVKVMVRSLYNKNVREYGCEMNPKKIKKKTSPAVFYFIYDGPFKNSKVHMVMLQTKFSNITTFTMVCKNKNCSKILPDFISITNSRSE